MAHTVNVVDTALLREAGVLRAAAVVNEKESVLQGRGGEVAGIGAQRARGGGATKTKPRATAQGKAPAARPRRR